jgi:hypothetical protein
VQVHRLEHTGERVLVLRHYHKMQMVGHETTSQKLKAAILSILAEQAEETPAACVGGNPGDMELV